MLTTQRGLCPCDPEIYRFAARMVESIRGGIPAPAIPAAEPALGSLPCVGRGRDTGCPAPPAQIPTCELPA